MTKHPLAAALVVAAFTIFAPSASAANYCVGSSPECTGSPVAAFDFDRAGVMDAVAAADANPGPDNVIIAAGTIPLSAPLSVLPTEDAPLTIRGAGAGQTVFTSSQSSVSMIYLDFYGEDSSASDFSLVVSGSPVGSVGVLVNVGQLSGVEVEELGPGAGNLRAFSLADGARLAHSSATLEKQRLNWRGRAG